MKIESRVIRWLLAGDPAIRWQVLQDVLERPAREVLKTRQRVALEGWGARLLARQDAEGTWAGGLYNPKWTSTTYTMLLFRDFGLPPTTRQAHAACEILLDEGLTSDGGVNFGSDRSETCITGMVLSIAAYFLHEDKRLDEIVKHLLGQQMPDGGWNCRRRGGATHSSMNTTISVLEGLRFFELLHGARLAEVRRAQARAREFLLQHQLFRSHRTGRVIRSDFQRMAFPPRWHYDILRALDYFRAFDAPRDSRLTEAVEIIRRKRRADGSWVLENTYRGGLFFEMEKRGTPSRWNTLRALLVLRWWDAER